MKTLRLEEEDASPVELSSASADITEPKVTSDLLMCAPSFSRWPVAPVAFARSLDKHGQTDANLTLYCVFVTLFDALRTRAKEKLLNYTSLVRIFVLAREKSSSRLDYLPAKSTRCTLETVSDGMLPSDRPACTNVMVKIA